MCSSNQCSYIHDYDGTTVLRPRTTAVFIPCTVLGVDSRLLIIDTYYECSNRSIILRYKYSMVWTATAAVPVRCAPVGDISCCVLVGFLSLAGYVDT